MGYSLPNIWTQAYDETDNHLETSNVGSPSSSESLLDIYGIIMNVFDDTNDTIRTVVVN